MDAKIKYSIGQAGYSRFFWGEVVSSPFQHIYAKEIGSMAIAVCGDETPGIVVSSDKEHCSVCEKLAAELLI